MIRIEKPQASPSERSYAILAASVWHPTDERVRALWTDYFNGHTGILWQAVEDEQVLGLVGFRVGEGNVIEIRHLAVADDSRNRGVARALIGAVKTAHPDQVLIAETHSAAVGFYRKCGLEVRSLGEKYPGTERFACNLPLASRDPKETG